MAQLWRCNPNNCPKHVEPSHANYVLDHTQTANCPYTHQLEQPPDKAMYFLVDSVHMLDFPLFWQESHHLWLPVCFSAGQSLYVKRLLEQKGFVSLGSKCLPFWVATFSEEKQNQFWKCVYSPKRQLVWPYQGSLNGIACCFFTPFMAPFEYSFSIICTWVKPTNGPIV